MAEQRAIKSCIWDDTWFGRLSYFEMVVWIGLFSRCADNQGRLQDDPALIRSRLFPFHDVTMKDIAAAMDKFDGHIIRYEKGEAMAQILRWWDNQPMQYATPSNYPPPDGWLDRYRTNYKGQYIVFNWPGKSGMESNSVGNLLWDALRILPRQSMWTSYLGTLNPTPTPTPTPTLLNNKSEGTLDIQRLVEQMTGYPSTPSDIPALKEMETLGVVKEDIVGALSFFQSKGKTARGALNLLQSVKFQVAQRIQSGVTAEAKSNGNGHKTAPVGYWGEDGLYHVEGK